MARGDIKQDLQVVGNGAYLDIRPPAGAAWRVKGVSFSTSGVVGDIVVLRETAANEITIETSAAGTTGYVGTPWMVTNTYWIRVKNLSGSSQKIAYDAIEIVAAS